MWVWGGLGLGLHALRAALTAVAEAMQDAQLLPASNHAPARQANNHANPCALPVNWHGKWSIKAGPAVAGRDTCLPARLLLMLRLPLMLAPQPACCRTHKAHRLPQLGQQAAPQRCITAAAATGAASHDAAALASAHKQSHNGPCLWAQLHTPAAALKQQGSVAAQRPLLESAVGGSRGGRRPARPESSQRLPAGVACAARICKQQEYGTLQLKSRCHLLDADSGCGCQWQRVALMGAEQGMAWQAQRSAGTAQASGSPSSCTAHSL